MTLFLSMQKSTYIFQNKTLGQQRTVQEIIFESYYIAFLSRYRKLSKYLQLDFHFQC